jgi:hypothetical protein
LFDLDLARHVVEQPAAPEIILQRAPAKFGALSASQAVAWLTSPPMTWALRRTPSERPAHASQPTTLRKLGPGNASGSGSISLPPSVNSFPTVNASDMSGGDLGEVPNDHCPRNVRTLLS